VSQSSMESLPTSRLRPRVLVLDDEWATLERLKTILNPHYQVSLASRAGDALRLMEQGIYDVVLTDLRMPDRDGLALIGEFKKQQPDTQYILMTAFSDIEDTISAIRVGVADYLRKPFSEGEVLHALSRCLERQRLVEEVAILRGESNRAMPGIITDDSGMKDLCRMALNVAATDASILISGETGTGKGLLARAIHQVSHRKQGQFVDIDCASIPASLIESELFGHERGAFTGAVSRKLGKVETGEGGTIMLDEIGEMPLEVQPKLLRFMQHLSFERVGGNSQLQADVRMIAATNRDLASEVREGRFRQDLFYRLHVIHLFLPPLRDRNGDVLLLAEHFREKYAKKYSRTVQGIGSNARRLLKSHNWPGNVRELEHAIERAVLLCEDAMLDKIDLAAFSVWDNMPGPPEASPQAGLSANNSDITDKKLKAYLAECERNYLRDLLGAEGGSIQNTARAAGINPKTLYLKMERHGLKRHEFIKMGVNKKD
jgi:DNA-binding NtrC family response regulator